MLNEPPYIRNNSELKGIRHLLGRKILNFGNQGDKTQQTINYNESK